jgi:hypothetical protein
MRNTEYGDQAYRHRFSFRKKMIFIPFLALGALALISYIVMLLWNALIPVIFHLGVISFWQALGLLILSKILFGFGGHGGRRGGAWMRRGMEARFEKMSPEDRERFKEQMRSRCGDWGRHRGHYDWDKPAGNTAKAAEDASKPVE